MTSPAGDYPITCARGTLTASNYTFVAPPATFTPGALTIAPENAAIQYTGGTWARLPSGGSATIPLQATVWDSAANGYSGANPESGSSATVGDITRMSVEFDIYTAGGCLTGTPSSAPVVQVSKTGTAGVGTANYNFTQSADGSFCVAARVVGASAGSANPYYTAGGAQVAGIALYTNSGQFATGGGWIGDAGSSTGKGSFGFSARYGNNGSPKGQIVYVWHGAYNGAAADFIVKSNALTTLAFTKNGTSSYSATLQGKCSYTVVSAATGATLYGEGNGTFSATATDGDSGAGQQKPSADSFALTAFQSGNTKLHPISATPLGGGNVAAHN